MKIVIHGEYSEFREDRNELVTVGVQKEFNLNVLSSPYIFQWMLGIFVLVAVNTATLLMVLLIDVGAFPLFFINIFVIPAVLAIIYEWSSSVWKKRNVLLINEIEQQWKEHSQEEEARAAKYREEHPLEEVCRKAFENCPVNSVAVADLVREIIGEQQDELHS